MTRVITWAGASLLALGAAPAQADELRDAVAAQMPDLTALYRDLHANPELSFQEVETSKKLAARARAMGFEVTEGVGKTGVVAVLRNGEGPVVMLRADMDGLPVVEQTGLPFASKKRAVAQNGTETGVMHACGHDTHMAAWIGTAKLLSERRDQWSGTLVMVLQPAEEIGQGAKAMLDDGLFIRFPKPRYVLAFHDAAVLPAGEIGYTRGFALANVDSVDLVVPGIGGHGAAPQSTRDPVVIAAAIVMRLQTLVSREQNPSDPAVVTVGSFQAGSKHNIIPDEARLQITVRSASDGTRKRLLDGIARVARGEAIAGGMPDDKLPRMTVQEPYTPATYNTPALTDRVVAAFGARFGERVQALPSAMVGEDFSQYYRADKTNVESLIFWVGGVPREQWDKAQRGEITLPSLHSSFWAPDAPAVIATATEAMTAATLDLMAKK
ncbi:amidohydrolase [Erythrobacter colymbi]|uniref:amidohydrolase n=1 Tax=Erythrobacter colymbi TaxID=1161202 RepID=UPI000A381044|nr:amidohydrolase [Erythrobacter colymbi]